MRQAGPESHPHLLCRGTLVPAYREAVYEEPSDCADPVQGECRVVPINSKLTFVWQDCRKFPDLDRWMNSEKELRETVVFQRTGPGRGASKAVRLYVLDYHSDNQFQIILQERPGRAMLHVKYRLGEPFLHLATLGSYHRHKVDPTYTDSCTQDLITHGAGYEKRRCHDCTPDWGHRTYDHLSQRDLSTFFMEAISHLRVTKHGHPPIRERAAAKFVDDPEGYA